VCCLQLNPEQDEPLHTPRLFTVGVLQPQTNSEQRGDSIFCLGNMANADAGGAGAEPTCQATSLLQRLVSHHIVGQEVSAGVHMHQPSFSLIYHKGIKTLKSHRDKNCSLKPAPPILAHPLSGGHQVTPYTGAFAVASAVRQAAAMRKVGLVLRCNPAGAHTMHRQGAALQATPTGRCAAGDE
jgi:hypothetical protein